MKSPLPPGCRVASRFKREGVSRQQEHGSLDTFSGSNGEHSRSGMCYFLDPTLDGSKIQPLTDQSSAAASNRLPSGPPLEAGGRIEATRVRFSRYDLRLRRRALENRRVPFPGSGHWLISFPAAEAAGYSHCVPNGTSRTSKLSVHFLIRNSSLNAAPCTTESRIRSQLFRREQSPLLPSQFPVPSSKFPIPSSRFIRPCHAVNPDATKPFPTCLRPKQKTKQASRFAIGRFYLKKDFTKCSFHRQRILAGSIIEKGSEEPF